jgi:hypothetical protein
VGLQREQQPRASSAVPGASVAGRLQAAEQAAVERVAREHAAGLARQRRRRPAERPDVERAPTLVECERVAGLARQRLQAAERPDVGRVRARVEAWLQAAEHAAEQAAVERVACERAAAERQAAAERMGRERAAAERVSAERQAAAERVARERAAAEHAAAERQAAAAERAASERAAVEHAAAERARVADCEAAEAQGRELLRWLEDLAAGCVMAEPGQLALAQQQLGLVAPLLGRDELEQLALWLDERSERERAPRVAAWGYYARPGCGSAWDM